MKKNFVYFCLLSALFAQGAIFAHEGHNHSKATKEASSDDLGYKEIKAEEVLKLINSKTPVVILDTRPSKYDDGIRIKGAKWVPYDAKNEAIKEAAPDKKALIIVYCEGADCPLSRYMAERLVKMGYTNVKKYPEGIEGWLSEGYPVDKTKVVSTS